MNKTVVVYEILNEEYDDLSTVYWILKLHRNLPYRNKCITGSYTVQQKHIGVPDQ